MEESMIQTKQEEKAKRKTEMGKPTSTHNINTFMYNTSSTHARMKAEVKQ